MPTGERCAALRSQLENDCLPRGADSRAIRSLHFEIGPQGDVQRRLPRTRDRLAQLGRQRIDRAALDARPRDDGFAAHGVRAERQRDALERLALEAVAKNVGPGDGEAAIGRPQRRYRDALGRERFHPRPVGAEPRPACAAERQHGRAGVDGALSVGRLKQQMAVLIPAGPAMAQRELHARCESSRRSHARSSGEALNAFGKHPAAGADEGRLPQRLAPLRASAPAEMPRSRRRAAASLRRSAREIAAALRCGSD